MLEMSGKSHAKSHVPDMRFHGNFSEIPRIPKEIPLQNSGNPLCFGAPGSPGGPRRAPEALRGSTEIYRRPRSSKVVVFHWFNKPVRSQRRDLTRNWDPNTSISSTQTLGFGSFGPKTYTSQTRRDSQDYARDASRNQPRIPKKRLIYSYRRPGLGVLHVALKVMGIARNHQSIQ